MSQRKALVFSDVARLADYVRLGYPRAQSKRGFILYEVTDPEAPRRTLLLLVGHSPRRFSMMEALSSLFSGTDLDDLFTHATIREDDDGLALRRDGSRAWTPLRVRDRMHSSTLIELVSLSAVSDPAPPQTALFLADDLATLSRIVVDSLALGNDRMALAAVGEQVLLRAEAPSWFLIERTLDAGGVQIFTPLADSGGRVWLPWGQAHPLGALWNHSEADAGEEWLLFQVGRRRLRLAPPDWRDVYDAADIELDFSSTAVSLAAAALEERFCVSVRLSPRARPAEPALWLVEEADRDALDRLLLSLDEADLEDLLIAPVRPESGGPLRYFLRERRAGQGRQLLGGAAQPFAPWQGISDLFLPADMALEPRLRRDRYRSLFGLGGGSLTVLAPPPGGGPVERLSVPTRAFAPLHKLVDFQLTAEAPRIEALQARSLFEFAPYSQAPSRPDLLQSAPRGRAQAPGKPQPSASPGKPEAQRPRAERSRRAPLPKVPSHTPAALSVLQEQEQRLEREIIDAPTAERWTGLGEVKSQLGKHDDVVTCAAEAWWLTEDRYEDEALEELLEAFELQLGLGGSASARCRALSQSKDARATLAYAFHGRGLPPGQVSGWLSTAERGLRQTEGLLPKKVRWLAWGELWRNNHDVRSQARVRESILGALDRDGVSTLDIPSFIQQRLLQDRALSPDEGSGESHSAQQNLSALAADLEGLPGDTRSGALAALGRAWYGAGRPDIGQSHLDAAQSPRNSDLVTAWVALQACEALAGSAPAAAEAQRVHFVQLSHALNPYTRKKLASFADQLATRRGDADADAFLSVDNVQRLFPTFARSGLPELDAQLKRMKVARQSNQQDAFRAASNGLLGDATEQLKKGADLRELGRVLFEAVHEIIGFEKRNQDDKLTRRYQEAAGQMLKHLRGETDFFALQLQISLGRGLIELKQHATGARALDAAIAGLRAAPDMITLDLTDTAAAALRAVESLPIDQRAAPLRALVATIRGALPTLADRLSSGSMLQLLQLLDQLCTSSSSKDQLTLTRFRQYQDLDEMLIRERVLREDFCT